MRGEASLKLDSCVSIDAAVPPALSPPPAPLVPFHLGYAFIKGDLCVVQHDIVLRWVDRKQLTTVTTHLHSFFRCSKRRLVIIDLGLAFGESGEVLYEVGLPEIRILVCQLTGQFQQLFRRLQRQQRLRLS